MGLNKAAANFEVTQKVRFQILDTAGTPTITNIWPPNISGDFSITDTAAGIYDVTIKNFKGPLGFTNIHATTYIVSTSAAVTARSYSGDDLSLTIKVNLDDGTDTDTSVDVTVEAF